MKDSSVTGAMQSRIKDHIKRVIFFYKKLMDGGLIPAGDLRYNEVLKHDSDKLLPENLLRQSYRFLKERTQEQNDAINDVVRDHVKGNPHHFEYWGKPDQDHRSTNINCRRMPDKYLYEMIADWGATAEEHGNTILDFYDMHKGRRFHFTPKQDAIIQKCGKYLEQFRDPNLKRTYSEVYIEPSKLK